MKTPAAPPSDPSSPPRTELAPKALELQATIAALQHLGFDETIAAHGLGASLRAGGMATGDTWAAVGETLPQVLLETTGASRGAELELGEILGEGGMGIVRLAVQNPLARDVAVKTPKGELGGAGALLVREAVTTGGLEHPNIVPIHALGKDADGAPLLVMKRISGVSWGTLIANPTHEAWTHIGGDPLEFHLETLMAVSNAVHFAHCKGVIHRDLKPENVMVGRYGEVYVLDWGIALTRAMARRRTNAISGTLAYMAPEMLRGDEARIDERTDVFLLGACLHEVLTGAPPHGGSLDQVVAAALDAAPRSYPAAVPEPLAVVVRRAMNANPDERYPSAEEFRRALAGFLRQRASLGVSAGARARLEALGSLLAGPSEVPAVTAYKLFGECRFGFQHAIETFPDNEDARHGLTEAVTNMARYELGRRNLDAASVLIAEFAEPPPEIAVALATLRAELTLEHAEVEKLRSLERDLDVNLGRRRRAILALIVALGFNGGVLVVSHVVWGSQVTLERALMIAAAFLGSVTLAAFIARDVITQNAANRRLAWALGVVALAMLAHRAAALQLHAPVATVFAGDLLLLATCGGTVAATLDRRFIPVSIFLALIVFPLSLRPEWMPYTFPLAATLGAGVLALGWRS